jgi:ABC-2 type transport system ATP-binding protein
MGVSVRTRELRKIYHTAPPRAAIGLTLSRPTLRRKNKKKLETIALDGISLEIPPGEIFGLLGPNGAGKSTTVGILTTRVRPTSGEAWIGDLDVWREPAKAKWLIGVVQQVPNLDFALTAREILQFHAAYFGVNAKERSRRASELLDRFQLTERADELVRGFSGGMMQRLSIARAMMHNPEVLFLDEPSSGLDPQTRLLLWDIIREYQHEGHTILLTTHNMEEADALCHRLAVIDRGKVIALGSPEELKSSVPGGYLLRLRFNKATEGLPSRLRALHGVNQVSLNGDSADIYAGCGGSLVPAVAAAALAEGVELQDIHISEPSLELFFLHHTGRSLRQ